MTNICRFHLLERACLFCHVMAVHAQKDAMWRRHCETVMSFFDFFLFVDILCMLDDSVRSVTDLHINHWWIGCHNFNFKVVMIEIHWVAWKDGLCPLERLETLKFVTNRISVFWCLTLRACIFSWTVESLLLVSVIWTWLTKMKKSPEWGQVFVLRYLLFCFFWPFHDFIHRTAYRDDRKWGWEREGGWHIVKGPGLLQQGLSLCTWDACSTHWAAGALQKYLGLFKEE